MILLSPSHLSRGISVAALLIVLLVPLGAVAGSEDVGRPETGLLWLRSDLPAVFPLQVKTAPGRAYHLTLLEHETGQATLAAFIRGGDFFRVLVPPGRYAIRVAHGNGWQNETSLFGSETTVTLLEGPFRFEVEGLGRKSGHLIDLRELIETREAWFTQPLSLCQSYRADLTRTPGARRAFPGRPRAEDVLHLPLRFTVATRLCG